jgi:hypothetical protein
MISAAGQLQEKYQEQHQGMYTIFLDLIKAFGTVSRKGLLKFMAKQQVVCYFFLPSPDSGVEESSRFYSF